MSKFNLPHKANVGEIIRVRNYEDQLFLVTEYTEEVSYDDTGEEECVTYTCINVDNQKEIKIVFDQDVLSIVVTADNSDNFIAKRQIAREGKEDFNPPAVQKENLVLDVEKLLKHFEEARAARDASAKAPGKQILTANEKRRADAKKAIDYVDYLLDSYSMLKSLDEVLGKDETRTEELMLIEEEFYAKSIELYGKRSS